MRFKIPPTFVALGLAAGFVALTLSLSAGAASVSASSEKKGELHLTKECSENTGLPGGFCTFTSSNLAQIPVGSRVYYSQGAGTPPGLDSNVVLDAGGGNRAVGRCTLDFGTGLGLCTFSDGTGQLTGFTARVDVVCTVDCTWDGTYKFNPQPHK
jgi:hypothetical protein